MTAIDITNTLNGFAGNMLEGAIAGIDPSKIDDKLHAHAWSIREQIEHLTECYVAAKKDAAGEKHEWGTYQSPVSDWDELVALWRSSRNEALALLGDRSDQAIHRVLDHVAAHDFYHVGQIVVTRRWIEPNWNPDAIYGEA